MRVWSGKGRKAYGARKVWRELGREGTGVARCTVERLMRELGIAGIAARKRRPRTTVPGPAGQERPSDLLERDFTAPAPNRPAPHRPSASWCWRWPGITQDGATGPSTASWPAMDR
jgi:transposase InsO family protein